ncbi:MAG: hypothetical protein WCZ17_11670 [Candidatus Kapaibacterium sp.]
MKKIFAYTVMSNKHTAFLSCLCLSLMLLVSCQDASMLDSTKEIIIIHDPNNLPPVFSVTPEEIDFKILHPGKTYSSNMTLKNISEGQVSLTDIYTDQYNENYSFDFTNPLVLEPQGSGGFAKTVNITFHADEPGNYDDIIRWSDYRNPKTPIKSKVASVWAEDISFGDVTVGDFGLKSIQIHNSSDIEAKIMNIEIFDPDSVILNAPPIETPFVISPKSNSGNIFFTFYPVHAKSYSIKVKLTVEYLSPGTYFTDDEIEITGNGKF